MANYLIPVLLEILKQFFKMLLGDKPMDVGLSLDRGAPECWLHGITYPVPVSVRVGNTCFVAIANAIAIGVLDIITQTIGVRIRGIAVRVCGNVMEANVYFVWQRLSAFLRSRDGAGGIMKQAGAGCGAATLVD
jgi:hypothetical protein